MRKIEFIITLVLFSFYSIAQSSKDLPQKIKDSFSIKYPAVQAQKWKTSQSEWIAQFTQDKKKYLAWFDAEGRWIRTETTISLSSQLPAIVQDSLHNTRYTNWTISEIKQVDQPGQRLYQLHVNDGNLLSSDHYHALKDDFLLWFDEKGQLVKKQKLR